MELLKIGVFVSMLSMTPMLEAQNISGLQKEQPLLLLEENLEQLSIGNEEEYGWEAVNISAVRIRSKRVFISG